jgi:ABC-2 type transport system ATP-binding protein
VLSTHILSDVQQVCDVVGVLDRGRLVFQGPLPDLLAATTSTVLVGVRPPLDPVVTALTADPLVTGVTVRGPTLLAVEVVDARAAEVALPRLLADAGAAVTSLQPAADLETAFLALTRAARTAPTTGEAG